MLTVLQISKHTLFSRHIEEPKREFFVEFDAPAYTNVLRFEAGRRWVHILAETGRALFELRGITTSPDATSNCSLPDHTT